MQILACVWITGAITTCSTAAINAVLKLAPLHILVETIAKRTTRRMIEEGLVSHTPQTAEDNDIGDMPRMPQY